MYHRTLPSWLLFAINDLEKTPEGFHHYKPSIGGHLAIIGDSSSLKTALALDILRSDDCGRRIDIFDVVGHAASLSYMKHWGDRASVTTPDKSSYLDFVLSNASNLSSLQVYNGHAVLVDSINWYKNKLIGVEILPALAKSMNTMYITTVDANEPEGGNPIGDPDVVVNILNVRDVPFTTFQEKGLHELILEIWVKASNRRIVREIIWREHAGGGYVSMFHTALWSFCDKHGFCHNGLVSTPLLEGVHCRMPGWARIQGDRRVQRALEMTYEYLMFGPDAELGMTTFHLDKRGYSLDKLIDTDYQSVGRIGQWTITSMDLAAMAAGELEAPGFLANPPPVPVTE